MRLHKRLSFRLAKLAGLQMCLLLPVAGLSQGLSEMWFTPVAAEDRSVWSALELTPIGAFGHIRPARPQVPAHLHTGIDIMRPQDNYTDEPVFPTFPGTVISKRDDGPYAQVIIEHALPDRRSIWTVYEHVAGIAVSVGDSVNPDDPIARFMNEPELDRHGWQFNHVHKERTF